VNTRWTRGQQTVLAMLQNQDHLLSAQEIYSQLRSTPQEVGLATVYRALETLVVKGAVQAVSLGDQQTYYQIKSNQRHGSHNLVCRDCKKVIPLPACPVSTLERELSAKHQFTIDYHVLDFFGLCRSCVANHDVV